MPVNQRHQRKVVSGPQTINGYNGSVDGFGSLSVRFTIMAAGEIQLFDGSDIIEGATWLVSGLSSDVQVLFTKLNGTGLPSNTGTWKDCSTSPQCSMSAPPGTTKFATVEVKFRNKTTLAILGTNTIAMSCDNP